MFSIRRVRLALADDGRILALLGAEIATPEGRVVMERPEMDRASWERGLWLRVDSEPG